MNKRVLLVEDERNIVEAVSFLLRREGWHVTTHDNGATALDAIAKFTPDLLVLDYMLPGRTGLQIVTELRAMPQFASLPVLMLTAKGQARDREEAERAGVTRFMTKPFSNREVLTAARDLVHLADQSARDASSNSA